jgi:hypothetical protein
MKALTYHSAHNPSADNAPGAMVENDLVFRMGQTYAQPFMPKLLDISRRESSSGR